MAFPTVTVEIGFGYTATPSIGGLVLSDPTDGLLGTAQLGPLASATSALVLDDLTYGLLGTGRLAPISVWTDVTEWVQEININRGRNKVLNRWEAGTCSLTLRNESDRFSPDNSSSPYGNENILPMRPIRITATFNSIVYKLFRGWIDFWRIIYPSSGYSSEAVVDIACTDNMKLLADNFITEISANFAGDDATTRIERILNEANYPQAFWTTEGSGNSTLDTTTYGSTALSLIQEVMDAEQGSLYVDTEGRLVFRERHADMEQTRSKTSNATFGDSGSDHTYTAADLVYDDLEIINDARIRRTSSTWQTTTNTRSQDQFLTHTKTFDNSTLQTDAQADYLSEWLIALYKDPEFKFNSITLRPGTDTDTKWVQVLSRDIGDRLTVNRNPAGGGAMSKGVLIEGIEHSISGGGRDWVTKWFLRSTTNLDEFLILNDSTRGLLSTGKLAW